MPRQSCSLAVALSFWTTAGRANVVASCHVAGCSMALKRQNITLVSGFELHAHAI